MITIEFIFYLEGEGWRHVALLDSKEMVEVKSSDFVPESSEKVWYTKAGDLNVCREYLLALWEAQSPLGSRPCSKSAYFGGCQGWYATRGCSRLFLLCFGFLCVSTK